MNPKTDTPESALVSHHEVCRIIADYGQEASDAREKTTDKYLSHYYMGKGEACLDLTVKIAMLTAQQSDTALKLQRCEEALRKANDIIDALAVALQHEAALERKGLTTVSWEALELASNFAALTHPTRNEGEKKV